jgi:hypothetical protein
MSLVGELGARLKPLVQCQALGPATSGEMPESPGGMPPAEPGGP